MESAGTDIVCGWVREDMDITSHAASTESEYMCMVSRSLPNQLKGQLSKTEYCTGNCMNEV